MLFVPTWNKLGVAKWWAKKRYPRAKKLEQAKHEHKKH